MGTDMVAELLGRFVNDLGATISAGNVLIGDELGLYQTLAEAGHLTPSELAEYRRADHAETCGGVGGDAS